MHSITKRFLSESSRTTEITVYIHTCDDVPSEMLSQQKRTKEQVLKGLFSVQRHFKNQSQESCYSTIWRIHEDFTMRTYKEKVWKTWLWCFTFLSFFPICCFSRLRRGGKQSLFYPKMTLNKKSKAEEHTEERSDLVLSVRFQVRRHPDRTQSTTW